MVRVFSKSVDKTIRRTVRRFSDDTSSTDGIMAEAQTPVQENPESVAETQPANDSLGEFEVNRKGDKVYTDPEFEDDSFAAYDLSTHTLRLIVGENENGWEYRFYKDIPWSEAETWFKYDTESPDFAKKLVDDVSSLGSKYEETKAFCVSAPKFKGFKQNSSDVFTGETTAPVLDSEPPAEPPLLVPSVAETSIAVTEDEAKAQDAYTEVPEAQIVQQFSAKPSSMITPDNPFGNYGRESFSCLFDKNSQSMYN